MRSAIPFFLSGALLALAVPVAGQQPFADTVVKTSAGRGIPREMPRAPDSPALYGAFNRTTTSPLDVAGLLAEDEATPDSSPLRMGVVQEFAPVSSGAGPWTFLEGEHEGWLWTTSFAAPGAKCMRLRLRPWHPPNGAELIMYNAQKPSESFGPLTNEYGTSGTFWTPMIFGEEVRLEYYLPPSLDPMDEAFQITVDALLNGYRGLLEEQEPALPCHLDVSCYPDWEVPAQGIAAFSAIWEPFGFICSAAMMNRVPSDFTPILMTAAHCWNPGAQNILATWFYQTPTCNGAPPDPSTLPQTMGITDLREVTEYDWRLYGMSSDVPAGVSFLGWNADPWPSGSSATALHHPMGSWKRISFGEKSATFPSHHVIRFPEGRGVIEVGTSGSPILDESHRVRGVSSRGPAYDCVGSHTALYGRFDAAFPDMSAFLSPTDPIHVDTAYAGLEEGTLQQPFNELIEGVFAVIHGSDVHIQAGTYAEAITIDKAMTLHAAGGTVVIQ